jgi:serine protease Do
MPKYGFRLPSLAAMLFAFSVPLAAAAVPAPAPAISRGVPESFADLVAKLSPTVVNVATTQTLKRPADDTPIPRVPEGSPLDQFFKDFLDRGRNAPQHLTSLGSGFIIDPSGLIITNNHVIEGADQINVTFNDGSTLPAKVVGRDAQTDIALLRVKPKAPLAIARLGDSDRARVGEWVVAIGNPFGLGGSVTAGIISARNRDINAGPYDDFIQTDAPINRGNSGGPLFNMNGEVIGVNSAIYSPSGGSVGIAFAIPSAMVKDVMTQLKQYGEVRRGWLGVRIQQVTDGIAQSLGLKRATGALVAGITAGGPAAKAGMQNGDLVLAFDSKPVPDSRTLPRMVADAPVGKTVPVEILRKGVHKTVQVTLGRLKDAAGNNGDLGGAQDAKPQPSKAQPPAQKHPSSRLGVAMSPLTPDLRRHYHIAQNVQGVVVTDVDEDGPASETNIQPGDVIVEVAQEPVKTPTEVSAKVEAEVKAARKMVLLLVNRDGEPSFVAVNLAKG